MCTGSTNTENSITVKNKTKKKKQEEWAEWRIPGKTVIPLYTLPVIISKLTQMRFTNLPVSNYMHSRQGLIQLENSRKLEKSHIRRHLKQHYSWWSMTKVVLEAAIRIASVLWHNLLSTNMFGFLPDVVDGAIPGKKIFSMWRYVWYYHI